MVRQAKNAIFFVGWPAANQELELTRDGGGYDEPPLRQTLHTDAAGALTISFNEPGVYLLMTRKSGEAPAGPRLLSAATSLTFEVTR